MCVACSAHSSTANRINWAAFGFFILFFYFLFFLFLTHFYPPNTAIMLWTAGQVLRKFSTSSVSTDALLLSLHHRMNSGFHTVTEKSCWCTLSPCQVMVTDIRRTEPGSVLIADQWVTVHVQVSLSQSATVFSANGAKWWCVSASLPRYCTLACVSPPPHLPPLTVCSDWTGLYCTRSGGIASAFELQPVLQYRLSSSRAAGKPSAQLRRTSLLIH